LNYARELVPLTYGIASGKFNSVAAIGGTALLEQSQTRPIAGHYHIPLGRRANPRDTTRRRTRSASIPAEVA